MSGCAILGATGQVGGSVLKGLLEKAPSNQASQPVHVLVRSRSKLEKKLQSQEFSALDHSAIEIFESADISNVENLVRCVRGMRVVFLCVAAPNNKPGCSIAQDQIKAIISALQQIRNKRDFQGKLPRIVMLSSAEAEGEPHFSSDLPWLARKILFAANSNVYNDLIAAEKILRQEDDWIDFTIMKPGGLSWDVANGHQLSLEKQQTFISYADLVNGMIEAADDESGKFEGQNVSVIVPGGGAKVAYENAPLLFKGVLVHLFPGLYSWLF